MTSTPSDYRYIRITADPIIRLGRYQTDMEKLWLAFQTTTNRHLPNRALTKKEKEILITRFNREHLPSYHGLILAITKRDEPIGYGALKKHDKEAGYTSVYVNPLHRLQGVFGQITDEIISLARESGATKLDILVSSEQLPIDSLLRRGFKERPPDPIKMVEGTPLRMRL